MAGRARILLLSLIVLDACGAGAPSRDGTTGATSAGPGCMRAAFRACVEGGASCDDGERVAGGCPRDGLLGICVDPTGARTYGYVRPAACSTAMEHELCLNEGPSTSFEPPATPVDLCANGPGACEALLRCCAALGREGPPEGEVAIVCGGALAESEADCETTASDLLTAAAAGRTPLPLECAALPGARPR